MNIICETAPSHKNTPFILHWFEDSVFWRYSSLDYCCIRSQWRHLTYVRDVLSIRPLILIFSILCVRLQTVIYGEAKLFVNPPLLTKDPRFTSFKVKPLIPGVTLARDTLML